MNHPLTVIASSLGDQEQGVAHVTLTVGTSLAEWLTIEAQSMTAQDERRTGYLDLAQRLRVR